MTEPLVKAVAIIVGALVLTAMSLRIGRPGLRLALRIAAAWMIAIALLAGSIPLMVKTPGSSKDHKE